MRALLVVALAHSAYACTTVLVGRKASADGSVYCSHTNDGSAATDPRLVKVPARDHAPGAKRPVFYSPEDYPRYVGDARGVEAYRAVDGQAPFRPIGFIDEVAHTYAYMEDTYGALNEKGVGTGESTCSCVDWTALGGRDSEPCNATETEGCALFSIDALSQVAMERASTAREAVELMGGLAAKHGFYGADSFEGSAESLMVVDADEGWIFHVLPHPSGASAVWAAERVPDDHVAVVTNAFVIRSVNLTSPRFLGSDLAGVARGYPALAETCPSNAACDFSRTFGDGEYSHKYYSGRRAWGMFRQLAPEHALDPEYETSAPQWIPYPASLPASNVSLQRVLDAHRDHYEGTPYDLTAGLAAGPFGTPNRYDPGAGERNVSGTWERAISIPRTSDSYVVQARRGRDSVLWWGALVPHATVYVPLFASQDEVPAAFQGRQGAFAPDTLLWAVRTVHTFMDLKFSYMRDDVRAFQHSLEAQGRAVADGAYASAAEASAAALGHAARAQSGLRTLFDELLFKYADGWVNVPTLGQGVGYPAWWLEDVNYTSGPPPIPE